MEVAKWGEVEPIILLKLESRDLRKKSPGSVYIVRNGKNWEILSLECFETRRIWVVGSLIQEPEVQEINLS